MSGLSERDVERLDYVVHATDCDFEDVVATVAAICAEALREAAEVMPFGYSHAAALLRERAALLDGGDQS